MKIKFSRIAYLIAVIIIFSSQILNAEINRSAAKKGKGNQTQRSSRGLFDLQENTVSNIQFFTTNYGIFGYNVAQGQGGGFWPRGSLNQYIFAGGIWFGAQKHRPDTAVMRKYVSISYNPNNGRSWMVPGPILGKDTYLADPSITQKYRTYFSTDFKPSNGQPINPDDGPNWPIWDASENDTDTLKKDRYFGKYIENESERNLDVHKKGPAFISGEDIFAIYKDTDLSYYDGGLTKRKQEGYPLYLEYHQTIYSWGFGDYRDFIFLAYDIINKSGKPLYECWVAPVMDVDIARAPNTGFGAGNDRVKFYEGDPSLNLAYQWTNPDRGEGGNGFGYLGFDFLESPAVIKTGSEIKWIGTGTGGLAHFDDNNWEVYDSENSNLEGNTITSIAIGRSGDKWFGTPNGLAKFDGNNWKIFNTGNSGLPNDLIKVVAIDHLGIKWIGTPDGLAKFDGNAWEVYNTGNSDLPDNEINTIAIDRDAVKWIGTSNGLAKFDSVWTVYNTGNSGLPNNEINTIAIDRSGTIWIGAKNSGLIKFENDEWTVFNTNNSGLPNNEVSSIAIDLDGYKWIGTQIGGLAKFISDTSWTVYNSSNSELPENKVNSVAIDRSGSTWIGTQNGLAKLDSLRWTVYNTSNSELPGNVINSVAFDVPSLFFLRKDSSFYDNSSQQGLVTFRNWPIQEDILDDENRYNYMALGVRDGDTGPGDKRFLMATGPFHMRPDDTVRVVVGMILAAPAIRQDADGSEEDAAGLIEKDKFAQIVYDNNFRAPTPPDRSVIKSWMPLNRGIKFTWDSTSEMSSDKYENGLDFMGYKIYRSRRPELDTFNVDNIENENKGPYGWKQIAEWGMPTPFLKSYMRSGLDGDENLNNPLLDSLRIIGFHVDKEANKIDTMAVVVMRVGQGVNLWTDEIVRALSSQLGFRFPKIRNSVVPVIASIDTSVGNQPWGPIFNKFMNQIPDLYDEYSIPVYNDGVPRLFLNYDADDPDRRYKLFDSVLVGIVRINPALMPYNPLFFEKFTLDITQNDYNNLPEDGIIRRLMEKDSIVLDGDGNPKIEDGDTLRDTFMITTSTVDAVYLMNTFIKSQSNSTGYSITALLPRAVQTIMSDSNHVRESLLALYGLIKKKFATAEFPEFEQTMEVRNDVIVPYMTRITNGRTFVDIGDDNRNGMLRPDPDPEKSELLINNIDYYYKVLAYDEGDFGQPTPMKINNASRGLPNLVEVYPRAGRAANKSSFEIIHIDSSLIGGLYNFNFFSLDDDRVRQNFDGHILELEFQPEWSLSLMTLPNDEAFYMSFYARRMTLTDTTTGDILFDGRTWLESSPCRITQGSFAESGSAYIFSADVITDPITGNEIQFGLPHNREIEGRMGQFSSGTFNESNYCYTRNMLPPAYGTLGFSFDFYIKQYGGIYRPDVLTTGKGSSVEATTPVVFSGYPTGPLEEGDDRIMTSQVVDYRFFRRELNTTWGGPIYGSFNNGPANYLVEFTEGGDTLMELSYGGVPPRNTDIATFRVQYLNLNVTNTFDYYRPAPDGDSILISYVRQVPHMMIDTIGERVFSSAAVMPERYYPDPRNLTAHGYSSNDFIGKFNIAAYGWINGRGKNSLFELRKKVARPASGALSGEKETYTGFQGKYFLSAISREVNSQGNYDTLDFVHIFNGSGVRFAFDYANKGKAFGMREEWDPVELDDYTFGPDFKPGDKVYLNTFGGAAGYPLPGAKILVRVGRTDTSVAPRMTDEIMDQITIIPNPYYLGHVGQTTPYDAKIYFTKLPKRCTIDIYTVTGDLVISLDHDESISPEVGKESVEVWNLLSKNDQRIQSQTLIALITTPDGKETVQKFTIVVGGFRLVSD